MRAYFCVLEVSVSANTCSIIQGCRICNYMEEEGNSNYPPTPLNASIVEHAQWSFQVSQGSVETLFKWGGKRLHHVAANLFRKLCAKFHQNCPSFIGDVTENILVHTDNVTIQGWCKHSYRSLGRMFISVAKALSPLVSISHGWHNNYLSSRIASPFYRYQLILLNDTAYVWSTCPAMLRQEMAQSWMCSGSDLTIQCHTC